MLINIFRNKIKFLIVFILLLTIISIPAVYIYIYISEQNCIYITPIKTIENINKFELLTRDKIYIGRSEIVSKENADDYLTLENYQQYLNFDNNYYFNNKLLNNTEIKLSDIDNNPINNK